MTESTPPNSTAAPDDATAPDAASDAEAAADAAATRQFAVLLADADRDAQPPASLVPDVMQTVWSELRRASMIPLPSPDGPASVAEHVVTATVEAALAELADLQVRTCKVEARPPETQGDDDAPATDRAHVSLTVTAAAAYGCDMPAAADRARDLARSTVHRQFDFVADSVDIDVVDLYDIDDYLADEAVS